MVSEPTPTMSVSLGVTGLPLLPMGSAMAGTTASALAVAATEATASSFLNVRMITAPLAYENRHACIQTRASAKRPTALASLDGDYLDKGRARDILVNRTYTKDELADESFASRLGGGARWAT